MTGAGADPDETYALVADRLALIQRGIGAARGGGADDLEHAVALTERMSEEILRLLRPDGHPELPDLRSGLTGRELEIAELIAHDQLTNAQLAQHLDISEKTVKTHVGSILRKLQIAQRSEIAWTLGVTQK